MSVHKYVLGYSKTMSPVANVTQMTVPIAYSRDVSFRTAVKEPKRSTSMPEMMVLPIPASVPAVLDIPARERRGANGWPLLLFTSNVTAHNNMMKLISEELSGRNKHLSSADSPCRTPTKRGAMSCTVIRNNNSNNASSSLHLKLDCTMRPVRGAGSNGTPPAGSATCSTACHLSPQVWRLSSTKQISQLPLYLICASLHCASLPSCAVCITRQT